MSMIYDHIEASARAALRLERDNYGMARLEHISAAIRKCFKAGGKLMICGNGGSAGDAQHIAAEFVGGYKIRHRAPMPAIALTTDTSAITAIGNDYGFDAVFSRQVLAQGRKGDLLWLLSTSGESPNIKLALAAAEAHDIDTIGFTGGLTSNALCRCNYVFCPAETDTAVIQQLHMVAAHAICGDVERRMYGG
jgi:D-sedoheptulose 7-phosphate isomerase